MYCWIVSDDDVRKLQTAVEMKPLIIKPMD